LEPGWTPGGLLHGRSFSGGRERHHHAGLLRSFPGQNTHVDLGKKLDFIALHETGHLYQRAVHLEGPDLFMQEFTATMLATAYALALRPELLSDTLNSRTSKKQHYTSFGDMDLIYDGMGFDNYDWLQVETVLQYSHDEPEL
jgi:hypothetical protein